MRSQEEKIRQMLDEFGRALIQAISGSPEANGAVRRIRQEGYALHLLLGCHQDGERRAQDDGRSDLRRLEDGRKPEYRLNGQDVAFLKSIGIDPTRSARRRRKGDPAR